MYYWLEMNNILFYLTKYFRIIPWMMEQTILCMKTYYEDKSLQIFQERYRSKFKFNTLPNRLSNLVHNFEAHGTFENRRTTEKIRVSSRKKVHALLIGLHATFTCAFNWTADIWIISLEGPLDIFGSWFRLNVCWSENVILFSFYKFNFCHPIICGPWFVRKKWVNWRRGGADHH